MSNKSTCLAKRQYFSEWTAKIHANDINFETNSDNFSVYKCSYCNFFHLTTQKSSETH